MNQVGCMSPLVFVVAIIFAVFVGTTHTSPAITTPVTSPSYATPLAACMPANVKLTETVSVGLKGANRVTVEQKLHELGATCNADNTLVDNSGKPITFYRLTGCWGNPPANYEEILQKQRDEIAALTVKYTIIEMTCNPMGILLY